MGQREELKFPSQQPMLWDCATWMWWRRIHYSSDACCGASVGLVAEGHLDAEFVPVESEHSAMSVCCGSSAAGARTFTATSSRAWP